MSARLDPLVRCFTCQQRRRLSVMASDITCKRCSAEVARGNTRTATYNALHAPATKPRTTPLPLPIQLKNRAASIKSKYGLTMQDYGAMVLAQDGRCAICFKSHDLLHVDHDHDSGAVRGLLCVSCNTGIGHLQDDPNVLAAAIDYLATHGKTVFPRSHDETAGS